MKQYQAVSGSGLPRNCCVSSYKHVCALVRRLCIPCSCRRERSVRHILLCRVPHDSGIIPKQSPTPSLSGCIVAHMHLKHPLMWTYSLWTASPSG